MDFLDVRPHRVKADTGGGGYRFKIENAPVK